MLPIFDGLRDITLWSTLFRMVIAFLCGAVIGLERTYSNKPAGFRTHILVAVGSTIASMTGLYLYLNLKLPTDISRMGTQVIAGLGFIGAGTIIVTQNKNISGLTTAAGLWVAGIIGLAIGGGFYEGALLTVMIVLLTEIAVTRVRDGLRRPQRFRMVLSYWHRHDLDQVMRYLENRQVSILSMQIAGSPEEANGFYSAMISLHPRRYVDTDAMIRTVSEMEGIISAEKLQD